MKPVVFVAMPFGKKKNPITGVEFDFNEFYERVFKPLNSDIDINMAFVREDLVDTRGIIHKTMIEKLLLSEYVIADLSFANPNVYYELGIRHCAKKYTTFLIFSDEQIMFDVAPLRAISYDVKHGQISDAEVLRLQKHLKEQLILARKTQEDDSPIYELLPDLNINIDISEEKTKSFKERSIWLSNKIDEINQLKLCCEPKNYNETIERLKAIANDLKTCNSINIAIWAQLISCFKDLEQYDFQIELLKKVPDEIFKKSLQFKQDLAFALNRLGKHIEAQQILKECLAQFGRDSETYGLLGRTYKDLYKKEQDIIQKQAYLDKAIDFYTKGFIHNMHDFYTGINAASLLLLKTDEQANREMNDILTAVYFYLRAIPKDKMNFWAYSSLITSLILLKEYDKAKSQLFNLYQYNANKWMFETTVQDYERIKVRHQEQKVDVTILDEIIKSLHKKISDLTPNIP